MLNDLRTGWAQPDKWAGICGGAYSTIYYGATKEECHAEMWSAGYRNGSGKSLFNSKAKDNFEECKIEQKKRIEEQRRRQFAAEQAAKKKRRKHYLLLSEKAALKRKFMEQEANERYYKTSTTKKLVSAYEKNLMESVERKV